MDYIDIENLVLLAKGGSENAKEELVKEFTPMIINIARKSFINSYEADDIRNECYKVLFKCVQQYNPDKHRFVAYATNAIKNSVNHLIRASIRRCSAEGSKSFVLDSNLENTLYSHKDSLDELLINKNYSIKLITAMGSLTFSERELVKHIYVKGLSLRRYSQLTGISYYSLTKQRKAVLEKLRQLLDIRQEKYLN